jgi:6-phosphogluconolactonase
VTVAERPGHEVRVLDTATEVSRAARVEFIAAARAAIESRGRFTVALSGGSTPKTLYGTLGPKHVEWEKVQVFFGDERCVAPDRPESNFRMAEETLLTRVRIPPENVHRIQAEAPSPAASAKAYEEEMRRVLGEADGIPRFDLVLLGIGTDGHTASLFPGAPELEETERWVVASFVARLARTRVTLTFPVLNRASLVVFLVAGDEKAEAVLRAIEGSTPGSDDVPARRFDPPGGRVLWLLDKLAASRLKPRT